MLVFMMSNRARNDKSVNILGRNPVVFPVAVVCPNPRMLRRLSPLLVVRGTPEPGLEVPGGATRSGIKPWSPLGTFLTPNCSFRAILRVLDQILAFIPHSKTSRPSSSQTSYQLLLTIVRSCLFFYRKN